MNAKVVRLCRPSGTLFLFFVGLTPDLRPGLLQAAPSGLEPDGGVLFCTSIQIPVFDGVFGLSLVLVRRKQQVPPLRRRWRSGSGRNDKVYRAEN